MEGLSELHAERYRIRVHNLTSVRFMHVQSTLATGWQRTCTLTIHMSKCYGGHGFIGPPHLHDEVCVF